MLRAEGGQVLASELIRSLARPASGLEFVPLGERNLKGFAEPVRNGTRSYPPVNNAAVNQFGLSGTWTVGSQSATAVLPGASITARFQAQHVYLVLTSAGNVARTGRVLLDGRPIPASDAGADVHAGAVTVRGQRLYSLVSLPDDEQRTLKIELPPGVSAYDFTFG